MKSARFSFVETLRFAVCAALENFLFFFGILFTWFFSLVGTLAAVCAIIFYPMRHTFSALFSRMDTLSHAEKAEVLQAGADILAKKVGWVGLLLGVVVFAAYCFFAIGLVRIMFDIHDRGESSFGQLFSGGSLVFKGMAVVGLYSLIAMLGLVFFIIPGIIAGVAFSLALYILVDKHCGVIEAFQESARLTKGSRMQLFALFFIIGIFSNIGLAYIIFWPVSSLALVYIYRHLQMTTTTVSV